MLQMRISRGAVHALSGDLRPATGQRSPETEDRRPETAPLPQYRPPHSGQNFGAPSALCPHCVHVFAAASGAPQS